MVFRSKKGYSGVAIFTKIKPDNIVFGSKIDQSDFEGRVIRIDADDISIVNAYYPSGTSGMERQAYKYQWLDEWIVVLDELKKSRNKLIICGDYNIAHREIDIHDPKGNKNSSGFLPEERAWMNKFLSMVILIPFVICTHTSHIGIPGGVSGFLPYDYKIKVGG